MRRASLAPLGAATTALGPLWPEPYPYHMPGRGLPPGQQWIDRPVVYDIAPAPLVDLADFRLRLGGDVKRPAEFTWDDLTRWPRMSIVRDFHCVTTWSVRAIAWEGVAASEIARLARPRRGVRWVIARGRDGYVTNLPYEAFMRADSLMADRMNGHALPPEHGYPLRLIVPSLYAWKSAKYVESIEFRQDLRRGFWEQRGYHDRGDPWREERFRTPDAP
jgi:DMSO/TMAO reductase YedYZ molybdopterin-dependent catalytic subunit